MMAERREEGMEGRRSRVVASTELGGAGLGEEEEEEEERGWGGWSMERELRSRSSRDPGRLCSSLQIEKRSEISFTATSSHGVWGSREQAGMEHDGGDEVVGGLLHPWGEETEQVESQPVVQQPLRIAHSTTGHL